MHCGGGAAFDPGFGFLDSLIFVSTDPAVLLLVYLLFVFYM